MAVARLALLLAQQGRAAEAAEVYDDALQGEPLGPQRPDTMEAIDALSHCSATAAAPPPRCASVASDDRERRADWDCA